MQGIEMMSFILNKLCMYYAINVSQALQNSLNILSFIYL